MAEFRPRALPLRRMKSVITPASAARLLAHRVVGERARQPTNDARPTRSSGLLASGENDFSSASLARRNGCSSATATPVRRDRGRNRTPIDRFVDGSRLAGVALASADSRRSSRSTEAPDSARRRRIGGVLYSESVLRVRRIAQHRRNARVTFPARIADQHTVTPPPEVLGARRRSG